jgi:glycogen debranching enzyme
MTTPPVAAAPAEPPVTVVDRPLVSFGREVCGDLAAGLRREWLVTNGLGGYASGTLAGIATRRYHGLLVAALTPPVGRTVLVGALDEQATYDGRRYPLSAHEFGDGTINPHGYRYLHSFALEGMLPVWVYALGDALLERRVWMAHGANTTYVAYRVLRGTRAVDLQVTPLITCRDFHTLAVAPGWRPEDGLTVAPRGVTVRLPRGDGMPPGLHLLCDGGQFTPGGAWWWNFLHREETRRGLDDRADLYAPGTFAVTLPPGARATLICTVADRPELSAERALAAAEGRQIALLRRAAVERAHPAVQQLVLAADQFLVRRDPEAARGDPPAPDGDVGSPAARAARRATAGRTVIAGYHWFNDWGRDTMIALPGLTLATGRPEEAAEILRTFARYVADGLLPNTFPDRADEPPAYNTADATLWYVLAVHAHHAATGDEALVTDLLPALRDIAHHHIAGTRFGIGVDPADGLLRAGAPGLQLTWMDAKVGDRVVTPRIGKPVEINALWYNVLQVLAGFLKARGDAAADDYAARAARARASFRARFLRADRAGLADVVDGPDGDDWSVRPNQIFAVALPFPLLEGAEAATVVEAAGRALLTSYGLRSLSPDDPRYHGDYGGDQRRRDEAYHQGTVWTWLMGAYATAHFRVYHDRAAALALLRPFEHHLRDAGLGSVSEILEGDPPHPPCGCIAQAWGVAEVLRVWRDLSPPPPSPRRGG